MRLGVGVLRVLTPSSVMFMKSPLADFPTYLPRYLRLHLELREKAKSITKYMILYVDFNEPVG
jgi:hypothetical protein